MIAIIKDKQEAAKETVQFTFEAQDNPEDFIPGQYIDIKLLDPPYMDDKGFKRHFSITNSPSQKGIYKIVTRMRDSAFKRSLKQYPLGTEVEITHIGGKFTLPDDVSKNYVFIAGGIGITPFLSMLRFINENHLGHKITLVYSSRDQASTVFLDELLELEQKLPKFKLIATMTEDQSWAGEKRRVDATFLKEYLPDPAANIYMIAGPTEMVEAVAGSLKQLGVAEENIIIENFTGY